MKASSGSCQADAPQMPFGIDVNNSETQIDIGLIFRDLQKANDCDKLSPR